MKSSTFVRDVKPGDQLMSPLAPRYVTMTLLFDAATLRMCKYAAEFVGLNPARNLLVLLIPVPYGSTFGPACAFRVPPLKYSFCQPWNGVMTITLCVLVPHPLALQAINCTV